MFFDGSSSQLVARENKKICAPKDLGKDARSIEEGLIERPVHLTGFGKQKDRFVTRPAQKTEFPPYLKFGTAFSRHIC
jgi:hypothetical protein